MTTLSLKAIADLANTSTATVSRVLSGYQGVRPHLRDRVQQVVDETGFTVNSAASALSRRAVSAPGLVHNMVAVTLTPCPHESKLPYIAQAVYDGIFAVATERGLGTTIWHIDGTNMGKGARPGWLSKTPVDGVLAFSPSNTDILLLRKCGPLVIMAGQLPVGIRDVPLVEQDDTVGIRALLEHLYCLGHRRFELVPFDLQHRPCWQRAEAFRTVMANLNADGEVAGPARDGVEAHAAAFVRRPIAQRPTALVVTSDGPAMELLRHLAAHGIRVPQDVSVVGFDGYPWGRDAYPPLTSWRPDWRTLGRLAMTTLLDALAECAPASRTLVGGTLIERESTGRPPCAAPDAKR